jgi:hypothetical protein
LPPPVEAQEERKMADKIEKSAGANFDIPNQ